MKVLVNCTLPFALAHGGQAIQIQRTIAALNDIGVDAQPLRWWDEHQTGDLIHYFGRMPVDQIEFAHQKKMKVIMAELLTAQGSQNNLQRGVRRVFRWGAENLAPRQFAASFGWEPYRKADAFIALPGGLGTLEELLEVGTWAQLGFHDKPIGLLDVGGYFAPLLRLLDHAVEEGFLRAEHRAMVRVEASAEVLLDTMARPAGAAKATKWIDRDRR